MSAGIFHESGLRAHYDLEVLRLCCTEKDRRLLFLIFSATGSSGCIRALWGLLFNRHKMNVWGAFLSCAVTWAVVLISKHTDSSVRATGDRNHPKETRCRQHHCPSYCSLPSGISSSRGYWEYHVCMARSEDLLSSDGQNRATDNLWKAWELQTPTTNPASMCGHVAKLAWAQLSCSSSLRHMCMDPHHTSTTHCRPSKTLQTSLFLCAVQVPHRAIHHGWIQKHTGWGCS